MAYVVGGGADGAELVVLDVAQQRVAGRIRISGDPQAILLGPDAGTAYVTQSASDSVAVVDARTLRVEASIPAGAGPGAVAASGMTLDMYIADTGGNTVTIFDLNQQRVVDMVVVGTHPSGIAVAEPVISSDGTSDADVYVANSDSNTVSVISAMRRRVIATIAVPGGPERVMVPSAGGVAYVSTRAGSVLALDLASHRLLGKLLEGPGSALGTMDYDAVTGQVYVPDAAHEVVYVLRPASAGTAGALPDLPSEPARTLKLAGGPEAVAITFDGAYLFVAERASGQVVMYDAPRSHLLATIDVSGAPRAIVTGPYPPAPTDQSGIQPPQQSSRSQSADVGPLPRVGLFAALMLALLTISVYWVRHGAGTSRRRRR